MILIADSGGTKTDWAIVTSASQPVVLNTQGILSQVSYAITNYKYCTYE